MPKFNFCYDQLCTVWYRNEFDIEADTQEEANKLAIEAYTHLNNNVYECTPVETTVEKVELKEDGLSTEEILTEDGDVIFMNGTIIN